MDPNVFGDKLAVLTQANISLTFISIGIQFVLFFYGFSVFINGPTEARKSRAPYVFASFGILFLVTVAACLDSRLLFDAMYRSTSGTEYLTNNFTATAEEGWRRKLSLVFLALTVAIGDGLLLYRCYILWKDTWAVLVLPALAYLAAVALSFVVVVSERLPDPNSITLSWAFLTISVNLMVTSLLLFRLIRARRQLSMTLGDKNLKVYSKVMSVLIESALPPAIVGIGYCISLIAFETVKPKREELYLTSFGFGSVYNILVVLAPQMIIFRVTTGNSWSRNMMETSSPAFSQPIVFGGSGGADGRESQLSSSQGRDIEGNRSQQDKEDVRA